MTEENVVRLREERASLESPAVPLSDVAAVEAMLARWGGVSTSGQSVNVEKALSVAAVWCGVDFLARTMASLPLRVYERKGGGRAEAGGQSVGGRAAKILRGPVNADLVTSYAWRYQAMVALLLAPGRAYTFVSRDARGKLVALWPLDPDKVTPERRLGRRRYLYREGSREQVYGAADVIDIARLGMPDGLSHAQPVGTLRDTIGLALDLQQYAARFFANGGMPPLALEGPVGSPAATARAEDDIHRAVRQANAERRRFVHLPAGYKLVPIGTDPEKGQLVEARRFQVEEIARFLGLPPVFLHDLTHGTFSNTEQQDLHFVKHRVLSEAVHWEEELNAKLFPDTDRFFCKFSLDGLLRGDYASRMAGHATAVQNGIRTPNEVRRLEDLSDDPDGERLMIQGATVPLGSQPLTATEGPAPAAPSEDDQV